MRVIQENIQNKKIEEKLKIQTRKAGLPGSVKINCVTHYLSLENSSVGERPAPRGRTTRPDERKITII